LLFISAVLTDVLRVQLIYTQIDIDIYIYTHTHTHTHTHTYIRTLISHTLPVSVYKTANEPIQQHTAVCYHSRLRWTALNLSLQQTVTRFYSWDIRRPFRSQV